MAGNENAWNKREYGRGGYEKQVQRISKPDMFMSVALWMEIEGPPKRKTDGGNPVREERGSQPLKQRKKYHKAGAVVVLPNDRALSVGCSEGGVHAAVSALNKFGQERVKNCQVYLSRRPCSFCARLLVQSEVSKVYYLPIEPELNDQEDVAKVDKLFIASSTGLSVYIPVSQAIIENQKMRVSPYLKEEGNENRIDEYKKSLIEEYWNEDWIKNARKLKSPAWPAFEDPKIEKQTNETMKNLLEWIARATKGAFPDDVKFEEINPHSTPLQGKIEAKPGASSEGGTTQNDANQSEPPGPTPSVPDWQKIVPKKPEKFIPNPSDPAWQKHALHMIRMAQMLSQRSDDPTGPVGCVLMNNGEVVALGWNGFPAKALYGEFPRASDSDDTNEKKKPYVIHAGQNALLTRNNINLNHETSVLFSNKIPCGECVPMLVQARVKNVVVPHGSNPDVEEAFIEAMKNGLKGFWLRQR